MSSTVFLAVLLAAALHAGWNAVLKVRIEPLLAVTLVNGSGAVFGGIMLLVTGWPRAEAWPWLIASTVLHVAYALSLSAAYTRADMGLVYPIARGTAPLLTMLGSLLLVRDQLAPLAILGVVTLASGIGLLAVKGRRGLDRAALPYALLTAVVIALYTLSDGVGARRAGDPSAYIAALFFLDGIACFSVVLALRGRAALPPMASAIGPGVAGGLMSLGAYWIAVWAMTVAPIALVAAVRETSVLFAVGIATMVLREPLLPHRVASAALIVTGLILVRMA
jgi:drug/metabolite transporter (DMT)-like permease